MAQPGGRRSYTHTHRGLHTFTSVLIKQYIPVIKMCRVWSNLSWIMKKNWGSFSFTHRNTFAPLFTHKHSLTIKWNSWEPNDKNLYRANQRKVCKYSRRLKNVHNTMQNVWECEKSGQSVCSMYTVYGKLFEYPENIAWNIVSHSATHSIFHF